MSPAWPSTDSWTIREMLPESPIDCEAPDDRRIFPVLPAVALPEISSIRPLFPISPPLLEPIDTFPESPFQVSSTPLPPEVIITSPPATESTLLSPPEMLTLPLWRPPSMNSPESPRSVFFLSPFIGVHVESALFEDSLKAFSKSPSWAPCPSKKIPPIFSLDLPSMSI